MKRQIALIFLIVATILTVGLLYANSRSRTTTRIFSPYTLLTSSWEMYKQKFINADGRVIDPSQNDITTSEGQSYALLRAVWVDDKATFDNVWTWTDSNLRRSEDRLFGWKWGQQPDRSYGILPNGGENSATDADQDIALALIFASAKWRDQTYAAAGQEILNDVWQYETIAIGDKRYLLAGRWAVSDSQVILNPSYFSPYAWRIFAQFDKTHDWQSLIDPAYAILTESGQVPLRGVSASGLPPDWVAFNTATQQLQDPPADLSTRYSYDAMRVPWRIALDYVWFKDSRALQYLQSLSTLSRIYQQHGKLTGEYEHDGTPLGLYESPAMYATALPYFQLADQSKAEQLYQQKISSLYSTDTYAFSSELQYYDHNWLWFSIALYHQLLPNLYPGNPP